MGKDKITKLVYESKFHSFFNDLTTFGFLLGSYWLNHEYIGGEFFVKLTLFFMFFMFLTSKCIGVLECIYSPELVECMKKMEKSDDTE